MNLSSWQGCKDLAIRLLILLAALAGMEHAQSASQRISIEEARQLAYEVVKIHNPGADITSSPRSFDPDFYFFAATWPNPTGSPIIGYFAVNPWTGHVWNTAGCERLTSKHIEKVQQGIRRRFHIKSEDYAKLRAKKPICGTE